MERIWNFLYYSTWKSQVSLARILIEKPLISFFNLIPFLRKNWNKGKGEYQEYMHDKDNGSNLGFAFNFMCLTTMVIYTSICLIVINLLNVVVEDTLYYYFIGVPAASYLTNFFFLYRADTYKKYFNEFENSGSKSLIYISALLFHVGAIGFGILSIHFTVGFNF